MPKEAILMAIDDFYIKIACQDNSKRPKKFHNFQMMSQRGIVQDGQIQDVERLKQIVREYLKSCRRKIKQVCIILRSDAILLRHMNFPHIPQKETRDAILHALKEDWQVDLSDFNFDHVRNDEGRVTVALAPKKMIADYVTFCQELKLTLVQVDSFPVRIAKVCTQTMGNVLFVCPSADRLQLLYVSEGFLYYSRYVRTLSYESIQIKLNRLTNYYALHTNLDQVYMISEPIEAVSDYFHSINIPCELYHKSDSIVFANLTE